MLCPRCTSEDIKLNGHIHTGKQNHLCKSCGRQFVLDSAQKLVSEGQREMINKLLLEKISLAGICRAVEVSEVWLQGYISQLYASVPEDLNAIVPSSESMEEYLADKFDRYIYEIGVLKKTLHRLSIQYHHRILRHLK